MGKVTKKKKAAKAAAPSRAPTKAPTKTGAKKRTSDKQASSGGTVMDMISSAVSSGKLPSLPALPSMSGSSNIQYNPMTGGFQRRKKSRKGLSASDIKGFMRVNKFAGMLTKVSGKKHHVVTRRRK